MTAEADPARADHGRPGKGWGREMVEALLIALVFAIFVRTWLVQASKIPSISMEDNLLVGDHILVNKFVYGPSGSALERALLPQRPVRRGDVVVFKYPEDPRRDFIKRCVGLPGERVRLIDKTVYIDDHPLDEDAYVERRDPHTYPDSPFIAETFRHRDNLASRRLPQDSYFCLGDNRDNSHDSRFWGPVPRNLVKGRALVVYWSCATPAAPLDALDPTLPEEIRAQLADGPGSGVGGDPGAFDAPSGATFPCLSRPRWGRILEPVR